MNVQAFDAREVARALGGEANGNDVLAPGPGHSPKDRSLSVTLDPSAPGGFLVNSFANDDWQTCRDYVAERLGLPKWNIGETSDWGRASRRREAPPPPPEKDEPFYDEHLLRKGYRHTATYPYNDVFGTLLYEVLRYDHATEPKSFLARRPGAADTWLKGAGETRVLYRSADRSRYENRAAFVTEGEKDADRLASLDLLAVTVAFGKWSEEAARDLAGYDCFVLEDNDEAGRKKALTAARALQGIANNITIVRIPGLPERGDVSDWLDAGGTRDDLVTIAMDSPIWWQPDREPEPPPMFEDIPAGEQPKAKTLPLIPFADLKPSSAPSYLVKGILPRVGLAVTWGPPKCGKSFWKFDLMMHVALGWMYRGRRVQQGLVVYCAFEGAEGFKARAEAFRRKHDLQGPVPLYLMPMRVDLVKDHPALIAEIRRQLGDEQPIVVVLDTLNRSMSGSESNDADMSAYIGAADAIREAFECLVDIVHHCGIDASRPRGHTSLTGAIDAQIAVKRAGTENITVTVEHMKDGPEGENFMCRLETIEVGTDDDGDRMTSCVIIAADGHAAEDDDTELSPNQKTMFAILHEAGARGLTVEAWNEKAREVGLATKRRAALYDLRAALLSKKLVRQIGERWFVAPC